MPSSSEKKKCSAIRTESAQSDSTELACDTAATKVMTRYKASTNQKHGPSACLHKLIPRDMVGRVREHLTLNSQTK